VKVLAGPSKLFELDYPFNKGSKPFGEVRVVLNAGLLLNEISPSLWTSGTIALLAVVVSTLLAAIVSGATLAPLRDIAKQLDRISPLANMIPRLPTPRASPRAPTNSDS